MQRLAYLITCLLALSLAAYAAPDDGIPVVFPALEDEFPVPLPSSSGMERDMPVDLVVLGTARNISKDNDHPRHEIAIEKVLFGFCPSKTITVDSYMGENERRIHGLARTLYKSEGDEYNQMYSLPPTEEKSQAAFNKARLDYYALSSKWIFVGEEITPPKHERKVRVIRVLRGEGLKPGDEVNVNLTYIDSDDRLTRSEPMVYCCSQNGPNMFFLHQQSIRLPVEMEPSVRDAMSGQDSYPVVTSKVSGTDEKVRRIIFTGSIDETIELLSSQHIATVTFAGQSLIQRGPEVRARLDKEIRQRLLLPDPGDSEEWAQENLCRIMYMIDRKGLSKILEELIASLESTGATKDSTNRSMCYLLDILDDGLWLARQHGKRLLALPDKLGPKQKEVVKSAITDVQLADRVNLADAVDRSAHLPVVRTERPQKPPAQNLRETILFTQDSSLLRTVTEDGILHTRDPLTLKIKSETKLPANHEFISAQPPDGKHALIAKVTKRDSNGWSDEYGNMQVIEFDTGKIVAEIPLAVHWRYTNTHEFWLPNNELLILDYGKWHEVNMGSGNKPVATVDLDISKENELFNGMGYLTEDSRNLLILDGGGKSRNMIVKMCDVENRALRTIGEIDLPSGCWTNGRGIIPDGRNFYYGNPGLYVCDRATLKPVIAPLFPMDSIISIAFSADGSKVAAVTGGPQKFMPVNLLTDDKEIQPMIRIHDLSTGKLLHAFPAPTKGVRTMALSPDGSRLVILRDDSVIESIQLK